MRAMEYFSHSIIHQQSAGMLERRKTKKRQTYVLHKQNSRKDKLQSLICRSLYNLAFLNSLFLYSFLYNIFSGIPAPCILTHGSVHKMVMVSMLVGMLMCLNSVTSNLDTVSVTCILFKKINIYM